jgi:hypothetical protein
MLVMEDDCRRVSTLMRAAASITLKKSIKEEARLWRAGRGFRWDNWPDFRLQMMRDLSAISVHLARPSGRPFYFMKEEEPPGYGRRRL